MSLLRDIQATAVDSTGDIAMLLRKCKILAVRLGNADLKRWVDQELNGYDSPDELPDYRILKVQSVGHFAGAFGSGMRHAPIPPICLPEQLREWSEQSYLMDPISSYAALVTQAGDSNAQEPWPPNLVALVARDIYQNMNCMTAWKVIPTNSLVAVIDTIKTRILSFSLEIEAEAPDAGEAPIGLAPLPQERVSQVFNTYITGNVQNVATASSQFQQVASGEFGPSDEVFRDLLAALEGVDGNAEATLAMVDAVREMRQNHGTGGFLVHYQTFMSILADHIQVFGPLVAPYLPALASLLT